MRAGARFPSMSLPDLDGIPRAIADAWSRGPALIAIGHSDCGTSMLTLPYLDRIRARAPAASVLVVLQDTPADARQALRGLALPALLEPEPYPLAQALALQTVPTLALVETSQMVAAASEGFRRDDLESFASRLGVSGSLFTPQDEAPRLRPG
ncbi:MAG TPA: hypothetical protein VGL15_14020 [Vicinamibacteria bacterium]